MFDHGSYSNNDIVNLNQKVATLADALLILTTQVETLSKEVDLLSFDIEKMLENCKVE